MRRNIAAMVVMLACACAAGSVASQGTSQGIEAESTATATRTNGRAAESRDTLNNAIAGPLITVISQQLGGRAVDMRLDTVDIQDMDVQGMNIRDRMVGVGPEFSPEMMIEILRARRRVVEIPASYYRRASGESKHSANYWKISRTALRMLNTIFRKRFLGR